MIVRCNVAYYFIGNCYPQLMTAQQNKTENYKAVTLSNNLAPSQNRGIQSEPPTG